jgi:hypothetical protein
MRGEVGGQRGDALGELRQIFDLHTGVRHLLRRGAREAGPGTARVVGLVRSGRPRVDHVEGLLELEVQIVLDAVHVLLTQDAELEQLFRVVLAGRLRLPDPLVEQRLGEARLVALVVAVTPVADEVDHHVFLEALAIGESQPHAVHHGLRIVPVHVEDRRLDHLGDVGAVEGRTGLGGGRREADLVVHHHMHGAAGGVARQLREVQGLGHDALAGEGRIAVHQHGKDRLPIQVSRAHLLGPGATLHHRAHRLQVGGIAGERQVDAIAALHAPIVREALVVLHVAGAEGAVDQRAVLELGEDRLQGLAEDVREHVQATPVGHADHDLAHADPRTVLDDGVEQGDQALGALQGEALLAQKLRVQEALEQLGRRELLEHPQPLAGFELGGALALLEVAAQPALVARVLDVGVLHAHRPAVGGAQPGEDLTQRLDRTAGQVARDVGAVHVVVAEAVVGGIQLGEVGRAAAERVRPGDAVPPGPVGVDQSQHSGVLVGELRRHLGAEAEASRARLRGPRGVRHRVLLEQPGPALVDGARVHVVALTDLFDERGVHAEVGERRIELLGLSRWLGADRRGTGGAFSLHGLCCAPARALRRQIPSRHRHLASSS